MENMIGYLRMSLLILCLGIVGLVFAREQQDAEDKHRRK
jgi:hypothetical protein